MLLLRARFFYSAFVVLLVSGLFAASLSAQKPKVLAPHRPLGTHLEKRLPWTRPMVRQSATGGLWMTDAKWKASLYLRNGLKFDPITVTPILYLSNGQRYPLSPVTLEPSGTAVVDIGQGLESVGIAPYATLCGYVEIEYQWAWAAVTASVKNVDVVNSLIFISGLQPSPEWRSEYPESLPARLPTSFEGLWWKQEKDVSGFLALSNVTAQAIHATVRLTDKSDAPLASYQVTVSPHGTKMLTLDELKTAASDTGGVYLTHDGPERGLDINGGLQDPAVGYSAHLRVWPRPQPPSSSQPQSPQTMTISELGLMTGAADPMMNFPSGTVFTPYSLVRNISEQPAAITPELWWMAGGSPQSATLPQLTLLPHQTMNLNLPALLAAAGLKNFSGSVNLILDTKAQAGALLMSSGSVDQTNNYVFEVIPHAAEEGASKALCYWSTGNGDDTMVTLWNAADEEQDLSFTLFYTGGQYVYPIQLGPRETRSFNMSDILHSSIPDAAGNVIPAGITEGSAEVAGSLGQHQHILIGLDTAVYNVRKATCGNYCWYCNGVVYASIAASPFAVAVGGTTGETFYETTDSGWQYSTSASWTSSSHSIATVNGSGVVTGVSVGSFSIGAMDLSPEAIAGTACTDWTNFCPTQYFSAPPPKGYSNPTVIFGYTPVIPLGGTATLNVTVNGNTNNTAIKLAITTTTGTGSAIFNNGQSTMNITSTTTLSLIGVIESSTPSNIQISASIPSAGSQGVLATTNSTVDNSNGAIPVNFRQVNAYPISNGVLELVYEWDSSTGNPSDLANCAVGEIVSYPGSAWNSPPYSKSDPNFNYSNPYTSSIVGTNVLGTPYNHTGFADDHKHPAFLSPYTADNFTATQYYRFQCTYYHNGAWTNITGPIGIQRVVSRNGNGTWQYTVAKSGSAASVNPLP